MDSSALMNDRQDLEESKSISSTLSEEVISLYSAKKLGAKRPQTSKSFNFCRNEKNLRNEVQTIVNVTQKNSL